MTVSSTTNENFYNGNGSQTVFPYTFKVFAASDMEVYVGGQILTSGYTVSDVGNENGGNVTFDTAPVTGTGNVALVRAIPLTQGVDLVQYGKFDAEVIEEAFDKAAIRAQQQDALRESALRISVADPTRGTANLEIPLQADRASRTMAFDASGDLIAGPLSQSVETVEVHAANVDTVASDITNVNAVAGNSANINAVAGNATNINAVNSNSTNVDAVAGDLLGADNIGAVAGNSTNINAVAGNETNINAVNANSTNVNTVATDLQTVGGGDIESVAGNELNINAVAGNETNINAVNSNSANINTVATDLQTVGGGDVETVATNLNTTNTIGAVAGNETNINTVAGINTDVTAVAGNETNITAVKNNATNVNALAADLLGVNNIGAVAGNSTNINTVAADTTAINNITTNLLAVQNAAQNALDAQTAAAAAATTYDSFDDRYLGSKTVEPTLDNDSNALVTGALYFHQGEGMKVYDGANWVAASASGNISLVAYEYTATSGQTTFNGADDNGVVMSYANGNVQAFQNGILLDTAEYTATNGTDLVLLVGAGTGDNVTLVSYASFTVANTYTKAESDGKYSLSTHNHTGVYLTPTGDGGQLTGIDALPDQTGHTDQFLKTNGATADWADVPPSVTGGGTDQVFYENDTNVTTDYTITTNKNAMSAGPITVNTGVTVTVPSGSEWTVV